MGGEYALLYYNIRNQMDRCEIMGVYLPFMLDGLAVK